MRILLAGATGFVGRHIAVALRLAGHDVRCVVRDVGRARQRIPGFTYTVVNFANARNHAAWLAHLKNIDVVINAAGIFREYPGQRFSALHTEAPSALFRACQLAGVQRVIQISALGAAPTSNFKLLKSKNRADVFLLQLPLSAVVLQPAPIFGRGSAFTRVFVNLAASPLTLLPADDRAFQPVHIDDICSSVLKLIANDVRGTIAAVGPRAITAREYIAILRNTLGYRSAWVFSVNQRLLFLLQRLMGSNLIDRNIWQMLQQLPTADGAAFNALLGRAALDPSVHINNDGSWRRTQYSKLWIPLLRYGMAALWIGTGIVSLFFFPYAESQQLLARSGFDAPWRESLVYMFALFDIAIGAGIVLLRNRRWLWFVQGVLILGYTLLVSWRLPELWSHPYGFLLKNLPLLAAIGVLYTQDVTSGRNR